MRSFWHSIPSSPLGAPKEHLAFEAHSRKYKNLVPAVAFPATHRGCDNQQGDSGTDTNPGNDTEPVDVEQSESHGEQREGRNHHGARHHNAPTA
jgi:hypothetical protein